MHVGYNCNFTNHLGSLPDHEVMTRDLGLYDLAEPLGFDSLWTVEHHFSDYDLMPNPVQFLSYMAGRTSRIKLGSGAVILPWHDPRRVVEDAVLLDHLSGGRFILGMGRGISRHEYEGYGVDMATSRERYTEYLDFVLQSLDTGIMERAGEHLIMPRSEVRPRPLRSFRDRAYAASSSPETMELLARLGLGLLTVTQKPWVKIKDDHDRYSAVYRDVHGRPAPPAIIACQTYVDDNPDRAAERAVTYLANYYKVVVRHYGFDRPDHGPGFEFYRRIADHIGDVGLDRAAEEFAALNPFGTPAQVFDQLRDLQLLLGNGGVLVGFSFGGMTGEDAARSLRLFAREVLPELKVLPGELAVDEFEPDIELPDVPAAVAP